MTEFGSGTVQLDPLLSWYAVVCTGMLFAHASLSKIEDLPLFEQRLHAYGVPLGALRLVAMIVALVEFSTAALVISPWHVAGSALAAALLMAYGVLLASQLIRGRVLDCGCGGDSIAVSWPLVVRNVLLAALAATVALPVNPRPMGHIDMFTVACTALVSAAAYAALHQMFRIYERRTSRTIVEGV
jgi:hypothetical protein